VAGGQQGSAEDVEGIRFPDAVAAFLADRQCLLAMTYRDQMAAAVSA
jgi:hypothetical protein